MPGGWRTWNASARGCGWVCDFFLSKSSLEIRFPGQRLVLLYRTSSGIIFSTNFGARKVLSVFLEKTIWGLWNTFPSRISSTALLKNRSVSATQSRTRNTHQISMANTLFLFIGGALCGHGCPRCLCSREAEQRLSVSIVFCIYAQKNETVIFLRRIYHLFSVFHSHCARLNVKKVLKFVLD
jgi:hypothetical protein